MSSQRPEEIANAFRSGRPAAVEIVQQRVRRIVGFRGYRMQPTDRRDLEQEIMAQLWQAVGRSGFDAGERFWGFVEVVSARRCIDWVRNQTTGGRELGLDENQPTTRPSPLGRALARERLDLARGVLAQLPEDCRELIRLHVGLGKSYAEVSERLGKSEGALRVQMHRCIAKARRLLSQDAQAAEEQSGEAAR